MADTSRARPFYSWALAKRVTEWLLLPSGIMIAFTTLFFLAKSLTVPYLGADIALNETVGWHVNRADDNGTAYRDGIRSGDRVLRVNGLSPEEAAGGLAYIGAFRAHSIETMDASGQPKASSASTGPIPFDAVQESISLFTVGAAFWITGFLSLVKRPGSRAALLLYLMGLSFALGVVSNLASVRGWEVARYTEVIGTVVSPWLTARFFFEFPFGKRFQVLGRDFTNFVSLPPLLLLSAYALAGHEDSAFYTWFRQLDLLSMAAGFLLAFAVAVHSYFTSSFARYRQQMRIVAIGAAIGILPLVVFSLIPEALGQGFILRPELATIGFVALPVSLGHVITRNKLLDIDLAMSRGLWYGLVACAFIASYMLLLAFIGTAAPEMPLAWRALVLLTFTVAALFLSAPIRGRLRAAIEARVNPERYDYRQAASETIADLATQSGLDAVTRHLVQSMTRFLRLDGASVLLNQEKGMEVSAAFGVYADYPRKQEALLEWSLKLTEDELFPNKAPVDSGAAFFVPLWSGSKKVGMLALSKKISKAEFSVDDSYFLHSIGAQGSLAIDNAMLLEEAKARAAQLGTAFDRMKQYADFLEASRGALEQAYTDIIRTLVLAIESRSPYTRGHSDRVTQLCRRIGVELGLSPQDLNSLHLAARIHDLGKLGTPDTILLKAGPLEHHERAEMELHPGKGVEIIRFLDFMRSAIQVIESHHEWVNGSGYPHGLRGEEIPLGGRIIAVADAFDAMTSDRPYRKACSSQEALRKLQDGAGIQWDRAVVEALLRLPGLEHEDV